MRDAQELNRCLNSGMGLLTPEQVRKIACAVTGTNKEPMEVFRGLNERLVILGDNSPPRGYSGAIPRQSQPQAGGWARQPAPLVVGLGLKAMQGMTNAMVAIANQVIRNSGRATRNAAWPYFDGMYRDYPAFKRKFASFRANYDYGTSSRELVQQFREMCLPEKIAVRIKSAETMEIAWVRLDAWFKDEGAFIKDLMQDIRIVSAIRTGTTSA